MSEQGCTTYDERRVRERRAACPYCGAFDRHSHHLECPRQDRKHRLGNNRRKPKVADLLTALEAAEADNTCLRAAAAFRPPPKVEP